MTPQQAFDDFFRDYDPAERGEIIGVAVSGGSDSMAVLHLALMWGRQRGISVVAATVDHGLRPAAAAEAKAVAAFCESLGIGHSTLTWTGWDGAGNLQAAARRARYDLLAEWAEGLKIDTVVVGHTADDQAETVLMALARGSGVDGLAGMAATFDGLFHRPLLSVRRSALQAHLRDHDITWVDDPSNDDLRFDRVKARKMLDQLGDLGLTTDRLLETGKHMSRARRSLGRSAVAFVDAHVVADGADLLIPKNRMDPQFDDTQGRVLAAALQWIGGGAYRPRFTALCDAAESARGGKTRTLNGVILQPEGDQIRLMREVAAATDIRVARGGELGLIWDRRWMLTCRKKAGLLRETADVWPVGLTVKALGDDITQLKNWRGCGYSRQSLMATPAVFDGETLLSAPFVDQTGPFLVRIAADFRTFVVTH